METVGSLLAEVSGVLTAAGFAEPRRHARRAVASALRVSQTELFAEPDRPTDEQQAARIRNVIGRLLEHEPLSRILGWREFWDLEFALSCDTLDPRPETETVVEAVLNRKADRQAPLRFLDLGTGTGCLLLALLREFPRASGIGVDIAAPAVRTALGNAEKLGLAGRAAFAVGNWGTGLTGKFDAILTNPPYIASGNIALLPREVRCFDPRLALDGGADGLAAYRAIASDLVRLLPPNGIFATEVGAGQAQAVAALLQDRGLAVAGIERDLSGIARCVVAHPPSASPRGKKKLRQKNVGMRRAPD